MFTQEQHRHIADSIINAAYQAEFGHCNEVEASICWKLANEYCSKMQNTYGKTFWQVTAS